MPRRGSRAQLLRDIAAWEARLLSDDDNEVSPEDVRGEFDHYSTEQLRELAEREEIEPQPRGRGPGDLARRIGGELHLVHAVEAVMRFRGISVTAACVALASRKKHLLPSGREAPIGEVRELLELLRPYHPISGPALRQRYYRAKRRWPKR